MSPTKATLGITGAIAGAFFVLTLLFGSWFTVDEGVRAVITTNGKITRVEGPGLHFKLPLLQARHVLDLRQRVIKWQDDGQHITGDHANMEAYSFDQQPAEFKVSVNYRIPEGDVEKVYRVYQTVENLADRVIARRVPTIIKTQFGQFTAVSAIQERERLNRTVTEAVQQQIDGPVIIDSVQIEDITFSDAFEQAIENRMLAQVEVEKRNQELRTKEIDAQITVVSAQAQADSQLAVAKAQAEAITLRGEAEARAIEARGKALADNPLLVKLTAAERWDGILPKTMLPGDVVPMLSLPDLSE